MTPDALHAGEWMHNSNGLHKRWDRETTAALNPMKLQRKRVFGTTRTVTHGRNNREVYAAGRRDEILYRGQPR